MSFCRTFYLANANPKDIAKVVQTAIPAQPGRSQTLVLEDSSTNSITVRDTEENIKLIGRLISSLDKDRAEVVMDVAIYEVNKTDLLRLGNQIGGTIAGPGGRSINPLDNLGGTNAGAVPFSGNFAAGLATNIATGLLIPSSVISAFQSRSNTKLVASTQIHAFNNEDSSARIGQRVPVRSAQIVTAGGNNNAGADGFVSNVVNYEQVGLTLKFKPIVFPNHDVQVAMEIESKAVASGGTFDNPIFTERTIKGTARVQNNKTLLLASVAQDQQGDGRSGLPILGWIPIIGRLFSTPTKDNQQIDIVIAVTPKVIRAPDILPEDLIERPTGSVVLPTGSSLEAMVLQEERDEMLAAARRLPTTVQVQLPDQPATDAPTYVRTNTPAPAVTETATNTKGAAQPATNATAGPNIRPIESTVRTLDITKTADTTVSQPPGMAIASPVDTRPTARVLIHSDTGEMKAGQKFFMPVRVESSTLFRSAVVGVNFDPKRVAVRSVRFGEIFGSLANSTAAPYVNHDGKMFVTLSLPSGTVSNGSGVMAFVEVEALTAGRPELALQSDITTLIGADGKHFLLPK
ncbi:MAG: hypothetical protein LC734_08715 [Acidobacteria bacterium]|nr:hypothetical protein [Acidobacteriota bacterium]